MIQILAQTTSQMQNVYTPLPMVPHFIFCLLATLLYLTQYYRKGAAHYLLIMAAVDLTFITQLWTTHVAIALLGALEVLLLAAYFVLAFRYSREQKRLNAEKIAEEQEEAERAAAVQKAEDDKNKKPVDNAFDE